MLFVSFLVSANMYSVVVVVVVLVSPRNVNHGAPRPLVMTSDSDRFLGFYSTLAPPLGLSRRSAHFFVADSKTLVY